MVVWVQIYLLNYIQSRFQEEAIALEEALAWTPLGVETLSTSEALRYRKVYCKGVFNGSIKSLSFKLVFDLRHSMEQQRRVTTRNGFFLFDKSAVCNLLKRDVALHIHNIARKMKCIFPIQLLDTFIKREQYISKIGKFLVILLLIKMF